MMACASRISWLTAPAMCRAAQAKQAARKALLEAESGESIPQLQATAFYLETFENMGSHEIPMHWMLERPHWRRAMPLGCGLTSYPPGSDACKSCSSVRMQAGPWKKP